MPNKIMIIGCCGSGKSTLSKKLHEKTRLPLVHLDREYYKPNWVKPTSDEWKAKVLAICNRDQWIMDGNYISSMETRMQYAEQIIWLDVNRITCLYRAFIRAVLPSKKHRSDMGEGCDERHDLEFYRFIWDFHKTTRPQISHLLKNCKESNAVILKNKRDIKEYLSKL
ncbi:MAG: topology modulation protein [Herbinix sp.]|nr:topology modulation protein [Herbinix sp.]